MESCESSLRLSIILGGIVEGANGARFEGPFLRGCCLNLPEGGNASLAHYVSYLCCYCHHHSDEKASIFSETQLYKIHLIGCLLLGHQFGYPPRTLPIDHW